jgi:periplasmic copper chaperone A
MNRSPGTILLAALVLTGCHPARGGHARAGDLVVTHAVIPASASATETSAFMVINNHGGTDAALLGVTSPQADSVILHRSIGGLMQPAGSLTVPAGGYALLAPGSYHLMFEGLRRPLAIGDTVALTLEFDHGGRVTVRAPVLNYTDAVSDLPMR